MKKTLILGVLATAGLALTGCDHFLNENRFPEDKMTDNPEYWNNYNNVQEQYNKFYNNFAGYGNGAGRNSVFYFSSLSDDQCYSFGSQVEFCTWTFTEVPSTSGTWNSSYIQIRTANQIITNVEGSTLNAAQKANAIGIARLNRAIEYFTLVKCYGDVPLITTVLDPSSEAELFGPRTPRNQVMDLVLEDLDYACNNIQVQSDKINFSKDMALAVKSEICLFEGTFQKYHKNDKSRSDKFLGEVVKAAGSLMDRYTVCPNYQSLYNSKWNADAAQGVLSLKSNPEVIFMKAYVSGTLGHSLEKYLSTTTPIIGMTKDAFDAYLMKDGKPRATTTLDTNEAPVAVGEGENQYFSIEKALENRDGRLAQTIDPWLVYAGNMWKRANSDWLASVTGYSIKKYVSPSTTYAQATYDGSNETCAPLYWLAQSLLDYAEAKAELGTLTDDDLNKTLNKLYDRAGLPTQTVAGLSAINDPANNMGVSSLIWEVRRCRRCELMFDKGLRYWDLIRWHQLELLDTQKHPNIAMGANLSTIPADKKTEVVQTGDYLNAAKTNNATFERLFSEKHYLYPIGNDQRDLNPNLTQNPGW